MLTFHPETRLHSQRPHGTFRALFAQLKYSLSRIAPLRAVYQGKIVSFTQYLTTLT